MCYMYSEFGVDSYSRFLSRARTDKQTNRQTKLKLYPTLAAMQPAWDSKRRIHNEIQKQMLHDKTVS